MQCVWQDNLGWLWPARGECAAVRARITVVRRQAFGSRNRGGEGGEGLERLLCQAVWAMILEGNAEGTGQNYTPGGIFVL